MSSEVHELSATARYLTFWSMEPPYKGGRLRYHLGQVAMLQEMEHLVHIGHEVSAIICDPPVITNARSRPESDSQRTTIERFLRAVVDERVEVLRMSDLCRDARLADREGFELVENVLVSTFRSFHVVASEVALSEQARRDLEGYRSYSAGPPPLSLTGPLGVLRRQFVVGDQDLIALLYAFASRPSWFESHNLAATTAMLSHLVATTQGRSVIILEASRNGYSWLGIRALLEEAKGNGALTHVEFPSLRLTPSVPSITGAPYMRLADASGCLFIDESEGEQATKRQEVSADVVQRVQVTLRQYGDPANSTSSIEDLIRKYRERARSAGLLATIAPDVPEGAEAVHLILRGGGAKGVALVGAAEALWPYYQFRAFWGTSAGAIVAVLLGAGYEPGEVLAALRETPISELVHTGRLRKLWNLARYGAVHASEGVRPWLDTLLSAKIASAQPVRMSDLPFHTTILAAQAGVGTLKFDSRGEHADSPVSFAVRSSIAIPFIFRPTSKDGANVYDGGLTNNFPLRQFKLSASADEPFLGILVRPDVHSTSKARWRRRLPVLDDLYDIWTGQDEAAIVAQHRERLVVIDTHPVRTLDLVLPPSEVEYLIAAGRAEAMKFLHERGLVEAAHLGAASATARKLRDDVTSRRGR